MYYNIIQEEQLDAGESEHRCRSVSASDGGGDGGGGDEKTTVGRNLLIFFKSLRSSARPRLRCRRRQSLIKYFHFSRRDIIIRARASSCIHYNNIRSVIFINVRKKKM